MTYLTSRQLNQEVSMAKKLAGQGPVVITDRGNPAHVLMTYDEYQKLTGAATDLVDALAMDDGADIAFDPKKLEIDVRPAEFD